MYNEIEPSGKLKRYTNGDKLIELHNMRLNELTGTDYENSFNFFNRNCNNSKKYKNTTIEKIREYIRNGTIVKEIQSDGTYIWKKVINN